MYCCDEPFDMVANKGLYPSHIEPSEGIYTHDIIGVKIVFRTKIEPKSAIYVTSSHQITKRKF